MAEGDEGRARIRLLGGFEVITPGGAVATISGRKAQGLLAVLALSPGMVASRDRLAGLLWSDRGDEQARNSLRQALVALRKDLGDGGLDIIEAEREQVRLLGERVTVDAAEMARLVRDGKAAEAAAFYGGALLDGIHVRDEAFEEWAVDERRRLADLAFDVHERSYEAANGPERLATARKLLAVDPLRESAHRAVMEALTAAGERDQALRQYETCRAMLAHELGAEPSAETERLKAAIMSGKGGTEAAPAAQPAAHAVKTERTGVAVLPLANLSGDPDQEFFADGLSEDLIAELSRYRHLSVVAYRTTADYKGRTGDPRQVGRELGVDFLIEGSVRRAAARVRVAVQLIDAETGAHVWADKFDREMADIFVLQDEIISAVMARLSFNLDHAAEEQRRRDPTTSSIAYSQFLKGRASWRNGDELLALECLQQAVSIDPGYARAQASAAHLYLYGKFSQVTGLGEAESDARGQKSIEQALAAERTDPFVLQRAAMVYLMLGEPIMARRYVEAAAREHPRDAEILLTHGLVRACCGEHREGVAMMERAIASEPRLPPGFHASLSDGRHLLGDFEGSLAALDAILDPPYYVRLMRVPSLARLGRLEEARAIVDAAPVGFDTTQTARGCAGICALREDAERWLEGFRLGGVPV